MYDSCEPVCILPKFTLLCTLFRATHGRQALRERRYDRLQGAHLMAKKKAASRRSQKRPDTDSQEPRIELLEPEEMTTGLDPHLQSAIIQNRRGEPLDSAFSHEDENGNVFVDVIARLNSASVNVPGLHITTRINQIVTGTVAVEDIEAVRANADVLSLKRATRLHSELDFSVGEINAGPTQIEAGLPAGTRIPD